MGSSYGGLIPIFGSTSPGIGSSPGMKSSAGIKLPAIPQAPVGAQAAAPPLAHVAVSGKTGDIQIESPVYNDTNPGAPKLGPLRLGAFDDPFRYPVAPGDGDPAYVSRPKRIEVDVEAVLHLGTRAVPARVYNLSAGGAFVAVDILDLPEQGSIAELGAAGYQPVKARVMHVRPRDPAAGLPAGLGLQLIHDPALKRPTMLPHVLLASPSSDLRRRLASVVARAAMLPVPASDVVAAYVASHTVPLTVVVLDPAITQVGDWRELPEGLGIAQRGTAVIALHETGKPHKNLPPWMMTTTIEDLGLALDSAVNRRRS